MRRHACAQFRSVDTLPLSWAATGAWAVCWCSCSRSAPVFGILGAAHHGGLPPSPATMTVGAGVGQGQLGEGSGDPRLYDAMKGRVIHLVRSQYAIFARPILGAVEPVTAEGAPKPAAQRIIKVPRENNIPAAASEEILSDPSGSQVAGNLVATRASTSISAIQRISEISVSSRSDCLSLHRPYLPNIEHSGDNCMIFLASLARFDT